MNIDELEKAAIAKRKASPYDMVTHGNYVAVVNCYAVLELIKQNKSMRSRLAKKLVAEMVAGSDTAKVHNTALDDVIKLIKYTGEGYSEYGGVRPHYEEMAELVERLKIKRETSND